MKMPDRSWLSGLPESDGPADVEEISLLLPGWQLAVLESAARDRGLTSGQLVRLLLRDFIDRHEEETAGVANRLNASCQW